jgi:Bcr/CflA subfamily drug resistance transporter
MNPKTIFPLLLLIYEFVSYLSNDMYLPSLLQISREFTSSVALTQATITCWIAGLAIPQLIIGPLSDCFGRRPVLLLGGILFLISTLGCAISPTIYFLLIARFFQGVGVCSMLVTGYASIHESFNDQNAINIIAWISSFTTLSPMLGPLLGSYILLWSSWRLIFWLVFCGALFAISALAFIMPESNTTLEKKALQPAYLLNIYRKIFSNSSFVKGALALGALQAGVVIWVAGSPFLLMNLARLSAQEFGWAQVPIFAAYAAGAHLVTPLSKKYGAPALIRGGFCLLFPAVILLVACNNFYDLGVWRLIIPMALYAGSVGLMIAPLNREVLTSSSEKKGVAAAAFYSLLFGMVTAATVVLNLSFNGTSKPFLILIVILPSLAYLLYFSRKNNVTQLS